MRGEEDVDPGTHSNVVEAVESGSPVSPAAGTCCIHLPAAGEEVAVVEGLAAVEDLAAEEELADVEELAAVGDHQSAGLVPSGKEASGPAGSS